MVKRKRGTFLAENIIFIVLNLAFLIILMLFLFKQGSGAILLEQSYAKQIALLINSAPAGTEIQINMQEGFELADKNKVNRADVVNIYGNIVKVKLSEKGGYEYSFFNDVDVSEFPGNIYDDSIKNLHFIIVNPKQEFLPENLNEVENEE
ncbi:hypothetical protein J4225_01590 [Candidatus Pacearchaeota archaeon]|nr:hypothetical protein [Candidatus Pacearchaeota archaeon]